MTKKKKEEKIIEEAEEKSEEETEEEVTQALDEISEAVETEAEEKAEEVEEAIEEVEEKTETGPEKGPEKGPIAVLLENPQIAKQIDQLKYIAGRGVTKTQKNVIVFYEHATRAGERFRGFLFFLLGASIMTAGLFAGESSLFTISEFLKFLAGHWAGRVISAGIGLSFMSYGLSKAFAGILTKLRAKRKKKEKEKFIQRKLGTYSES
jgi:hypothetical protein